MNLWGHARVFAGVRQARANRVYAASAQRRVVSQNVLTAVRGSKVGACVAKMRFECWLVDGTEQRAAAESQDSSHDGTFENVRRTAKLESTAPPARCR